MFVAFRKEGVDWNIRNKSPFVMRGVAFRKEGVDWNAEQQAYERCYVVAFRKEGVDWNAIPAIFGAALTESPSARKVWIEMMTAKKFNVSLKGRLPQGRCGLKCSFSQAKYK